MKLLIFIFLLFQLVSAEPLRLELQQYTTTEKRKSAFKRLNVEQLQAFHSQTHRRLKHKTRRGEHGGKVHLQAFHEEYDAGSLAYVAKVCVGKMCGKCDQKRFMKKSDDMCVAGFREGIKANEFLMLLDTGSTNVFLMSSSCRSKSCDNHNHYKPEWQQGNTFDSATDKRVAYISGANNGKIVNDDLFVGDLKIAGQPLFVATSVNLNIAEASSWDGIMGLGYWYDPKVPMPATEESIIDHVLKNKLLTEKVFTYYIPEEKTAVASFGEVVDEMKGKLGEDVANNDKVHWTPVVFKDEQSQWLTQFYGIELVQSKEGSKLKLLRLAKGSRDQKTRLQIDFQMKIARFIRKQKTEKSLRLKRKDGKSTSDMDMCGTDGCKLLVDTGTYLNFVPTQWFQQAFPEALFTIQQMKCADWKQMPEVVIKMKDTKGKPFSLTLNGQQYMDHNDGEGGHCSSSICPDTIETDLLTLGQVFLRNFYTIFNFEEGKQKIGFYPVEELRRLQKKKG